MVKILKLFILLMVASLLGCKSQHTTTTRDHFVSDTLIKHSIDVITLPTNYTFIDKNPCKNDSLVIADMFLEIGKLKVKVINLNGALVLQAEKLADTTSISSSDSKHVEIVNTESIDIETKHHIPKWALWTLGIVLFYIAYRIARIFVPFLKLLPY